MNDYTQEELLFVWLAACAKLDDRARSAVARTCAQGLPLSELKKICAAVIQTGADGVYNTDRTTPEREAEQYLARLSEKYCFAVTPASADYPEALRAIPDPPIALFCMGRRELFAARKFCIVGSRLLPAWAAKTGKANYVKQDTITDIPARPTEAPAGPAGGRPGGRFGESPKNRGFFQRRGRLHKAF